MSKDEFKIGHFNDSDEVLEFVNSSRLKELGPLGTSCPDHFLRTKIRPLILDAIDEDNLDNVIKALKIIMDNEGISISKRRITLSTSLSRCLSNTRNRDDNFCKR